MQQLQNLIEPQPIASPIEPSPWFVMLTAPQQDLTTVWRLHELGLEMFVPVIRRRVKTGRIGRNGQKVTRVIAKPMFPGYGFLRATETNSPESLIWRERQRTGVRGVREFMRDAAHAPITLPHQAVLAVFQKQTQQHWEWLQTVGVRRGALWKRGDLVRVDAEGGAYAGLVATVDKVCGKDRIELLFGMIRHSVRADMVVAA